MIINPYNLKPLDAVDVVCLDDLRKGLNKSCRMVQIVCSNLEW